MTELEVRQKYVNILYSWYKKGLKESNGSHMQIINIYNACTPLPRGYKVKSTDSWCATTVSAAAILAEKQTGIKYTSIIPRECSCPKQIDLFKKLGEWQENDAYVPTVGDVIYYDWQDNGVGNDTGTADHVGVVYTVSAGYITVIEGNKADAMGLRRIKINGKYIRGFGVPKYSKLATSSSSSSSSTSTPSIHKAGTSYYLNNAAIYTSSTSTSPAAYRTGKVYIYDFQVINKRIRIIANASDIGKISKVIGWVNTSSLYNIKSPVSSTTSSKPAFAAGAAMSLKNVALYSASTSSKAASHVTGNYYVWSTQVINKRIRITTAKSYAGRSGKITGWISYSAVRSMFR